MSETAPNTAGDSTKRIEAFYTGKSETGPKVSIFVNNNPKSGAPKFTGTVGEQKVGGYIRNGSKGPFLALVGDRDSEGKYPQLGIGNIIVNKNAKVRLSLKMTGSDETIWVNVSDSAPQELMVECGLDLKILEEKKKALGTPT